jgi:rod shape-determining protein MreC
LPEFLWRWRKELIFSLLALIAFGLLLSQNHPGFFSRSLRHSFALILVPLQRASMSTFGSIRESLSVIGSFGKLRAENRALRAENQALRLRSTELAALAEETVRLREDMGYVRQVPWDHLTAEVIGRDPASWLERVMVNRGSADGVKPGAGVITPQGVAGRVIETSLYAATVMLLPDPQSSIAGVIERSRVPGTLKGTGQRFLLLQHISGEDDVKPGDVAVTSPVSSLFPPGLYLGDVLEVRTSNQGLTLEITVQPRVNFTTLERVLILRPKE